MTPNDKNYVDRLHNQQVNELNEIKNRLLVLEGKPTVAPNGTVQVELDTDKLYEILFNAYEDCLQQRQERHQEKDRQAEERLRQECEAKGEPYFATEKEMCIAMIKEFNTFYRLIITYIKRTEKKFVDIHMDILKHLGASTSTDYVAGHHSLFSKLPSCFLPKIHELRHRITNRIHTYLLGNFSLPRGWTLLIILLYSLSFILLLYLRTTIMVSRQ
jgi:hypothetical protein